MSKGATGTGGARRDRPPSGGEVTQVLQAVAGGDERAADQLVTLVYAELRRLARAYLARERPGQTLQPTALVHEAYVRLLGGDAAPWRDRSHFFNAAATAMRHILVDRARHRARQKRGGDWQRTTLDERIGVERTPPEALLDLDRALDRLAALDRRMARVVELHYFAGLTIEETATTLGLSKRTVDRTWTAARAWLHAELSKAGPAAAPAPG